MVYPMFRWNHIGWTMLNIMAYYGWRFPMTSKSSIWRYPVPYSHIKKKDYIPLLVFGIHPCGHSIWLFLVSSCILWTSLGMTQIKSWRRYEFGLPPSPNPLETCATSFASTTMIINSNNNNGSKIGNRHNHSNKNNMMVSDNDNNTGKHLKLSKALSKHCK